MKKYLGLLAIVAVLLTSAVTATDSDDFNITEVHLDEYDVTAGTTFGPVYAGDNLMLKVFWEGTGNDTTARIIAELADEEEKTDYFTVKNGWTGYETLVLNLDSDIDPGQYTLNIVMEDEDGNRETFETLVVEVVSQMNLVEVYDWNAPQGTEVQAGETLYVSTGVRNYGHSFEEDVYVKMTIPALGLTTKTNKFDLVTEEFAESSSADDDDDFKVYKDLYLTLPLNTPSSVYDVLLEVVYDDGDSVNSQTFQMVVGAGSAYDSEIEVDTTSQTTEAGKAVAFWVSYTNPNVDYAVEVNGADFADVTVAEESNGAYVFVSVNEDAEEGLHEFTVTVSAGSNELKSFDLTVNVTEGTSYGSVKQGLELGFSILLVILVILGIIVAAKKLRSDNDEPIIDEDQTYY
tara:strand:- start:439 stop:1650 length:1212 start_codon:yes stop_codon:yes gene_type:complete